MESFAVLYNTSSNKQLENLSSEIHVNFWKLPCRFYGYTRYIDFGIRVNEQSSEIDSFSIFCPFAIHSSQLMDLGGRLVKDNFIEVLLNDDYEVRTGMCPCYHYVGTLEKEKSFWIYELNKDSFTVQSLGNGSLITIAIKSKPNFEDVKKKTNDAKILSEKYNIYIRFRIALLEHEYSNIEQLSNDLIQNAFSKVELFDFHLNEKREIPSTTYEKLMEENRHLLLFSMCQFFFVGSSNDEVDTTQKMYRDSRLIDKAIWRNYVGRPFSSKDSCIAYYWKFESINGMCNLFYRSKFTSYNFVTIIKYVFVVVLLGYVASLLVAVTPGLSSGFSRHQMNDNIQNADIQYDNGKNN